MQENTKTRRMITESSRDISSENIWCQNNVIDPEKATSTLTSDGILTITAPRKPEAIEQKKEKTVKIEHIGKPVKDEPQRLKQSQ